MPPTVNNINKTYPFEKKIITGKVSYSMNVDTFISVDFIVDALLRDARVVLNTRCNWSLHIHVVQWSSQVGYYCKFTNMDLRFASNL